MELGTVHGVNLCGWLVLESWVTPSLFASTGAFDEEGLRQAVGDERYAQLVDQHRERFITEQDFRGIAARGYNAVRLPVPWTAFTEKADGTPSTLDYVDQAFDWAELAGIKVLLDVVVDPDGAAKPGEQVEYIATTSRFRPRVIGASTSLAERYAGRSAFLGIEPLNEPVVQKRTGLTMSAGVPVHVLRNFYRDCYDAIRAAGGSSPVVVLSCAGRPDLWNGFMASSHYRNVWLDLHLYHYGQSVDGAGPAGARKLVERSRRDIARARRSGLPVIVGEWSSALPVSAATLTPEGLSALERVYAAAQIEAFRSTTGWFFQTWKTEAKLSAWDARVALSSFERGMFD